MMRASRPQAVLVATAILVQTLALPLAAACGKAKPATPSPEAIATAESASRPVSISAPYSTTPTSDDGGKDPIVLDGRLFGAGPTGVILAHARISDATPWFPFATELARTGRFTVLTFNFRGYDDSTGEKQFDRIDTDLEAAYDYMRTTLNVGTVFLVGASMGGTASLVLASRVPVAGVVAISAEGVFPPSPSDVPSLNAVDAVKNVRAPKLFITSEDDVPQARSQEAMWEAAPEPKDQEIYDGNAHGTDLFDTPHADDFRQRLVSFLTQ